jgi:3-oxoacyl-[acyl-carrier-protein] synthase-3
MSFFNFDGIYISGISTAVPKQKQLTESFRDRFGTEVVDKFINVAGVRQAHRSIEKQTASDLGFVAAEDLINKLSIDRSTIGALVFVSHSFDYKRPATACVLQKRLGFSKDCTVFDIGMGCSGFVYAMQVVGSCMKCSDIEKALVIIAETPSKVYPPKDRTYMLMGDAASAVLLEKNTDASQVFGLLKSDGYLYDAIITPAGASRHPDVKRDIFTCKDGVERSFYNTHMHGADVFAFTITDIPVLIREFFARTDTRVENYESCIFHQANLDMMKQFSKRLKIGMDKIPVSLDRYGNTTCSSIPLTICDRYSVEKSAKLIKPLMCGFGVGLSLGVMSADIKTEGILPIIESDDYYMDADIELSRY